MNSKAMLDVRMCYMTLKNGKIGCNNKFPNITTGGKIENEWNS